MKTFAIKFVIFFILLLGGFGYFACYVNKHISGDLGALAMIPFGEIDVDTISYDTLYVRDLQGEINDRILPTDTILTIGDSFSQQGTQGYQQMLGASMHKHVLNITRENCTPEQAFIRLVNRGNIVSESTVIVESVERSFIRRLANLNFTDSATVTLKNIAPKEARASLSLERFASWIRLRCGYKNPVLQLPLKQECFSETRYARDLFIYHSPEEHFGDLIFTDLSPEDYAQAIEGLAMLKGFADMHDVRLVYLVAADKYDAYEVMIGDNEYPNNPTMDYFVDVDTTWFVDSKRVLQPHIVAGVKDVYLVNDSHWAPVGTEIVGEYMSTLIQ